MRASAQGYSNTLLIQAIYIQGFMRQVPINIYACVSVMTEITMSMCHAYTLT